MVSSELTTSAGPSLLIVEAGLTLLSLATAVCWPRVASRPFSHLERIFGRLARKQLLSVVIVAMSACVLRLVILPLSPIPQPYIQDDFSYLLAADTFAAGRLTNPTHPMWVHFESFHVTHVPTYMSMYFPAQGMLLAAGKILAGHPWYGVWASVGLMCAAICWMIQAWLPPSWALLGGFLAIFQFGMSSYWINSYAGGAVAAIGGALVLGALPRIRHAFRARDFFWMALGMAILANSRPYEGLFVCVPALVALSWWTAHNPHPPVSSLVRRTSPAAALLLLTAAFMAYYNYRVFGNPLTPPYKVNRETYASAPHFLWQSPRPQPLYRHKVMRDFYSGRELPYFLLSRSPSGMLKMSALKLSWVGLFFIGIPFIAPAMSLPRALCDRRIRFLSITGALFGLGLSVETWLLPHYIAPFTAGLLALLLQSMRHMRFWRPGGQPAGLFLVRAAPVISVIVITLCTFGHQLGIAETQSPGLARSRTVAQLQNYPGQQLAIVRYAVDHDVLREWVYNSADIENSKIVWAREMDPASNRELLHYFKDRHAWLVEPDSNPPSVSPYPVGELSLLPPEKRSTMARNPNPSPDRSDGFKETN